jgi:hypothetical protein
VCHSFFPYFSPLSFFLFGIQVLLFPPFSLFKFLDHMGKICAHIHGIGCGESAQGHLTNFRGGTCVDGSCDYGCHIPLLLTQTGPTACVGIHGGHPHGGCVDVPTAELCMGLYGFNSALTAAVVGVCFLATTQSMALSVGGQPRRLSCLGGSRPPLAMQASPKCQQLTRLTRPIEFTCLSQLYLVSCKKTKTWWSSQLIPLINYRFSILIDIDF